MKKIDKDHITSFLIAFSVTLPLAFCLIFFGYLPLKFDAVIYTDNIVGEGTCTSYLTDNNASFAYLYQADAYFGSELKTLRLVDLTYNVESVELYFYDVEEADIVSMDISVFGRNVSHLNKDGTTHPYTKSVHSAVSTGEESLVHLTKDEQRGYISVGFPGNTIIPASVWVIYFLGILLAAIVLAIGLTYVFKAVPGVVLPLLSASAVLVTMIMGCFLCGSLPYVDYTDFILNWLLLYAFAILVNSLTLPWIGTAAVSVFTLFWYIANHYVILFRNKPIMPADLKAIGTAKEVVGGYDLSLTWRIAVSIVVVLSFIALVILVWRKTKPEEKAPVKTQIAKRSAGIAAAIVLIIICINNPAFSQLNTFQWDARVLEGFHREGIVLTFVKSAMSGHVKMPEGYSRETVESYLEEYTSGTETTGIRPTRIIMVMDEAFSDLRTVGLDENIDVMPFVDKLDDNTTEGNLYVSVLGGGTCNTEFEALTGNTLAFLGVGAYPYTENVTKPMFSLASYFRDNDYLTEAFHANGANNWNRNIVYPNLGFGTFHSIEDYPELTKKNFLRNYATDATDYSFIEERDDENSVQPRFLFDVTIQNHADYDHFEDLKEDDSLKAYDEILHQNIRVYLSLIRESDKSVEQLVEHYRNSDEPTMIIFFGDHQPMLPPEAQSDVYTNMQGYIDYFKTRFFIWTNYETKAEHDVSISANYLPWLILEKGNFALPPYVQMLKEVHEKYPVISSQGVIDNEGNIYDNVAVLEDDPLIKKYRYVQYANMFDEIDPAWFKVAGK